MRIGHELCLTTISLEIGGTVERMLATLIRLTGVIAFVCAMGIAQGSVVYNVNIPFEESPAGASCPPSPFPYTSFYCAYGFITGTISTNGKLGLLDPSTDILAWNLSVFVPPGQGVFNPFPTPPFEGFLFGPASYPGGSGNPARCISGFGTGPGGPTSTSCLEATPTELLVPFSPPGPFLFVEICPPGTPPPGFPLICVGGGFVDRDPLQFTYTIPVPPGFPPGFVPGYGELDFGPGQVVGTTPEPDNAALLGCGLAVLYYARRRFRAPIFDLNQKA